MKLYTLSYFSFLILIFTLYSFTPLPFSFTIIILCYSSLLLILIYLPNFLILHFTHTQLSTFFPQLPHISLRLQFLYLNSLLPRPSTKTTQKTSIWFPVCTSSLLSSFPSFPLIFSFFPPLSWFSSPLEFFPYLPHTLSSMLSTFLLSLHLFFIFILYSTSLFLSLHLVSISPFSFSYLSFPVLYFPSISISLSISGLSFSLFTSVS